MELVPFSDNLAPAGPGSGPLGLPQFRSWIWHLVFHKNTFLFFSLCLCYGAAASAQPPPINTLRLTLTWWYTCSIHYHLQLSVTLMALNLHPPRMSLTDRINHSVDGTSAAMAPSE